MLTSVRLRVLFGTVACLSGPLTLVFACTLSIVLQSAAYKSVESTRTVFSSVSALSS